jgi:hypothetical protein
MLHLLPVPQTTRLHRHRRHQRHGRLNRVELSAPSGFGLSRAYVGIRQGHPGDVVRIEQAKAEGHLAQRRLGRGVRLDGGIPGVLQPALDTVEEGLEQVLDGGRKPRTVAAAQMAVTAARLELAAAGEGAEAIAEQLVDITSNVQRLTRRHRDAALAVLSDEAGPLLIHQANTGGRDAFIMASKGLRWLEAAGASSPLIAAELRSSWHDAPEVRTSKLPAPDLDSALEALLADPRAPLADLV